jgi:hypothetical protein
MLQKLSTQSNNDILDFDGKLLKLSYDIIDEYLAHLFNLSFSQSVVPNDWKKARVVPIYKGKGSRSDPSCYRPISVICHIAKLFESCIKIQLLAYLNEYHFISCDQSAFLSKHSTVTALHKVTDEWLTNIDEGLITCVCFFDITKCFDAINHSVLLFKLEKYGFRNNELRWFTSYLTERTQATLTHSTLSSFMPISTGVPQGSILGPILFLLFINDLPQYVLSCSLYADDTLIERSGKSLNDIIPKIQSDINCLHNWFQANKLTISSTKTCYMLIGSPQRIRESTQNNTVKITLGSAELQRCDSYKYLGLQVDNSLTWNNTVDNLCKTLRSSLAGLQRLNIMFPSQNMKQLYYSFFQCHIDYCLTVWGQTTLENINKIQRFQNRAARIISNNYDYDNYAGLEIVKSLDLFTIAERKDFLTLVQVYKCLNNLAPHYLSDLFTFVSDIHDRVTRQSQENDLYVPKCNTTFLQKSLLAYGSKLWNQLPPVIRMSPTVSQFKTNCKQWLFSLRTV